MVRAEFYRNRRRARLIVGVATVLLMAAVAFTTWGLMNPEGLERAVENSFQQKGVVALPFALLLTPGLLVLVIFHGRRAADDRPLVVLDGNGVFYRDWRIGRLPWADITGYQLVQVEESGGRGFTRSEWYLEVQVRNAERYLVDLHGGGEFSEGHLRRYFRIPLKNVEAAREELLSAFRTRMHLNEAAALR